MLRAGELTLLAFALTLAVASMATVGLFSDRTRIALEQEANRLLGADLVLTSSRPLDADLRKEAVARGLSAISTLAFRSMVIRAENTLLAEITAVEPGYPLRGTTRIATGRSEESEVPVAIPATGTLWADERLFGQLGLKVGEQVGLGNRRFTVAALLAQDPSLTLSVLGMGPRLVMSRDDVASTGLIAPGSRVVHRLLVAGARESVESYRQWAMQRLPAGVRLEGVRDARPEIRNALERAERFMSLAALTAVALATVAVMLAGRRFQHRQLDVCAMLRCLGASQWRVFRLQLVQLVGVGVIASLAGALLGYASQMLLGHWLASMVGIDLPQPGVAAALRASVLGLVLLLSFGLPPLLSLRQIPALRVLRRELGGPGTAGAMAYVLGAACVAALVLWHAGDIRLGGYVLAGSAGTLFAAGVLTWLCLRLLKSVSAGVGVSWRYGIASLRRRPLATVWQVVALALGLAAVLTLTLIRSDLLRAWQGNLPADAPNRFLINIQSDEVAPIESLLGSRLGTKPEFYPMVRARLVAINGTPVDPSQYGDDRARRLVEREFNVSWTETLPAHNRITAGVWLRAATAAEPALSVEEGIARTLGVKLGDRLTYDVAGERFVAPVTSLRKVEWDSFRVNFFVIGSPGLLAGYPATYITSFHLPPRSSDVVNDLIARFPTVVVIDVASLVFQVQAMIEQVSRAITFIFLFTVAAGVLVLYAGIVATHDERLREVAIMRTLGANRRQVLRAYATEFALIGALAGLFAAAAATGLGYFLSRNLLGLPYSSDPVVWLLGLGVGVFGVCGAGIFFTRRVLATPPLASLRQLA
ncbi:MAG: FtsX-like permease family protein [Betaproteobacteria bacterium]|nr:MAG: FtsX-like permease family protein [Betaproteobacteria bacterium]